MKQLVLFGTVLTLALFSSCESDELDEIPSQEEVLVWLDEDLVIPENSGEKEFKIHFSKPAVSNGFISIQISTQFPDAFFTHPAIENSSIVIPVESGSSEVKFSITPVNDLMPEQEKTLLIELANLSEHFVIGKRKSATITISDDDVYVFADFAVATGSLQEDNSEGILVVIRLSSIAPEPGTILIHLLENTNNSYFATEPSLDEFGNLNLPIVEGDQEVSFTIKPVDDMVLKGTQTIDFIMSNTDGVYKSGTSTTFQLSIFDDELKWKPKSYESTGGGWRYKKMIEYDESGRVSKVHWESATPFEKQGVDIYYYSEDGQIEKINKNSIEDEYFFFENNRVSRSEIIKNNIVKSYSEYDYDHAGNIAAMAVWHLQPSGEYVQSFVFIYLYFTNGNLYKKLTYIPDNSNDHILISTHTYGNYLDRHNPFPMVEIVPNVVAQKQLPGIYRVEENGHVLNYNFTYTFNDEGLPLTRTVSGSGNEFTAYEYY